MLTDMKVRTAKPRPKSYKLTDANRLHVLVTPAGGKLWRWSYSFDSKQKGMAFGSSPKVSLSEARIKRDDNQLLRQGPGALWSSADGWISCWAAYDGAGRLSASCHRIWRMVASSLWRLKTTPPAGLVR